MLEGAIRHAIPLSPSKMVATGAASALVGIALFLGVHALLIVPVWPTLMRTIVAVLIGTSAAWAFEELLAAGALPRRIMSGAAFGGIMWLILVPMNAFGALLRITGLRSAFGVWELIIEIGLVVALSAGIGWRFTQRKRGAVALTILMVLVTFLTGGPLPMTASLPAVGLFVSFLFIFSLSGLVLAAVRGALASP
jgi:hypothetical protein